MSKGMEELEKLWGDIVSSAIIAGGEEAITDKDLTYCIVDRFGSSIATLWHYERLLTKLEWIKKAKSGKLFFLNRNRESTHEQLQENK